MWNVQREIRRAVAGFVQAVVAVGVGEEGGRRHNLELLNRKLEEEVAVVLKACQIS